MRVNQVTLFKIILFTVCVVLITLLVVKLNVFDAGIKTSNMCQMLIIKPDVIQSAILEECPEGFNRNYGRFDDVKDGYFCCVKYR
jgi:hypothetical protein